MASTTSPNMNLIIPTAGSEPGPTYALDINSALTLIDQHDHSPGKGVQITPAGMNINQDLSMGGFSLIDAGAIVLSAVNDNTTLLALYVKPGDESPVSINDLWFNDGAGNQIQITSGGTVNASIGSLPGESYAFGTFTWKQGDGSTTPANFDIGSITVRPNTAGTTFGVTINPPSGISSAFSINLPNLPVASAFLTIDNSGIMGAGIATSKGITASNITDGTIVNSLIADATIAASKLAYFTNLTSQTFTISAPSFNVRVATTANGTFSTAFDNASTVDGVVLATNDKILIKNQTLATENGVYVVQASGSPVRDTSYDTFSELNYASVHVTAGTTNANTNWYQNNILTSLGDDQSWSRSQTIEFVVPTGITHIIAKGSGGGGAGGSSKVVSSTGGLAAAGGGGGAPIIDLVLPVTPGESLAVTVGAGGFGAADGAAGANGSVSKIVGTNGTLIFPGGGGGGGLINNAGTGTWSTTIAPLAVPGDAVTTNLTCGAPGGGGQGGQGAPGVTGGSVGIVGFAGISFGAGGGGGSVGSGGGTPTGGAGAPSNMTTSTSSGGAVVSALRPGGGGGGSSWGVGGNGGSNAAAGSSAAADTGAGGGGASGITTNNTAHAGGNGGSGKVILYWIVNA